MRISKPDCQIGDSFFDKIDMALEISVNPNSQPASTERRLPEPIGKISKYSLVNALVAAGGLCTRKRTIPNAQLVSVEYPEKPIKKETYVHIPDMCESCPEVNNCPLSLLHNITPTNEQLKRIEELAPGASIEI